MKEKEDLSLDGPYSPISIRKTIDHLEKEGHFKKNDGITVFISNYGMGFDLDDSPTTNIMIEDRIMQAHYFIDEIFPKLPRIPAYLYRYIQWMMFNDGSKKSYDEMKYPTDGDYIYAIESNELELHSKEYQEIHQFIKWGKSNTEATHLIGLLQLVGGSLRAAAKQKTGIRFFIELPETGFHPKRERLLVTLLNKLKDEYGYKP